jgi:RNA polymerase sigma factor (sigma-70 family)
LQAKGISKTGLLAWIATCVTNKCRSLFKSEKRRSRREQSWWQEEQDWVQGESTPLTPDEILVRKEAFLARKESSAQLWRIVQETLNELTSDLSGFPAFKHRYIDGLSAQETAEKLQIPVNTVYQQTGRFLGKIRNRIRAKMKAGDPCQEWYETLMLSREDWTEYYADSLRGDPLRSP